MQHQSPVYQVLCLDITGRPFEQIRLRRLQTKAQGGQDIRLGNNQKFAAAHITYTAYRDANDDHSTRGQSALDSTTKRGRHTECY